PALVGKGFGDARVLGRARHLHVEGEIGVDGTRRRVTAADRRGVAMMWRRGEGDVAFAGEQARGGIESDPARPGKIDLAPGVEVGKVVVGAGRAVERYEVRLELDEVARDETRGEAE